MEPARRTRQRIVPLGNIHGRRVEAVVTTRGDNDLYHEVSISYRWREGRRWRTTVRCAVLGSAVAEFRTFTHDFTGSGHKQLLVSCNVGRVGSYLFDLDGDRLTTLYRWEVDRVVVRPVRGRRGSFDLVEAYPPEDWEGGRPEFKGDRPVTDLGPGIYRDGFIRRTVHWNGKAFVPYHPGPSRVTNPSALPPRGIRL